MTHLYTWRNYPPEHANYVAAFGNKRATMYGRKCAILARGTLNSRLIRFEDGQMDVVSGNSLRRLKAQIEGAQGQRGFTYPRLRRDETNS